MLVTWLTLHSPTSNVAESNVTELFPSGEIRVGVDASYPPFAAASPNGLFGLDIDLGEALAAKLNVPVRFVNMGYDGLYDSLRADQVDVLISALSVDPSRMNDVRYTRSYFDAGLVLVSDANATFEEMSDLAGHTLAFELGSSADAEARLWLRRVQPFTTAPYELPQYGLDALRIGNADAALVDSINVRLYLRDHLDWNIEQSYVTHDLYAIATRADRGAMWAMVNSALQSMYEDGTIDAIIERWL